MQQGTASDGQLAFIERLRRGLPFDRAGFDAWLSRYFKIGSVAEIRDAGLARKVIGALISMDHARSGLPMGRRRYRSW